MIRKEFEAITEEDLRGLCETKRAEDERIEFKRAFKGGSNLSLMPDSQRDKAIAALAKEVVSFLNHTGGDLVVGIAEDDEGAADTLSPIEDAADAAERLRRSFQARVEPEPRAMRIRNFAATGSAEKAGYIVIRCEPSLQAPHRIVQSKEFYIRKGSEAAPMDISEVHELTLRTVAEASRTRDRLSEHLESVQRAIANNRHLTGPGFQARVVYAPLQPLQVSLEDQTLGAVRVAANAFFHQGRETSNDVAFRTLGANWRPVLRGKLIERWVAGGETERAGYASKRIQTDGTIIFDWFSRYIPEGLNAPGVHFEWFQGFLAEISHGLRNFEKVAQIDTNAVIGLIMRTEPLHGNLPHLLIGSGIFESEKHPFPAVERVHKLPLFHVREQGDYNGFFQQAQKDLLHICGIDSDVATLELG